MSKCKCVDGYIDDPTYCRCSRSYIVHCLDCRYLRYHDLHFKTKQDAKDFLYAIFELPDNIIKLNSLHFYFKRLFADIYVTLEIAVKTAIKTYTCIRNK